MIVLYFSNKSKLFNRDRSNMSLKERKSITSISSTPRQEKMAVERSNSSANVDASVSLESINLITDRKIHLIKLIECLILLYFICCHRALR